ncbi:hypothetical protein CHS0354_011389 [Potamilus streckersoni]|uniref:Uncharacterized protein n=1 Tax=Potamilus streckersoni TaxID=2493646 RepID=A0AAE0W514_9BIVA|nr:hypothetical protein CHS0354_011389 [Potamilus streckersoni]
MANSRNSKFKVLLGPEYLLENSYVTEMINSDGHQIRKNHQKTLIDENGFEKKGDSNVYKRTRINNHFHKPTKLERVPTLILSGTKAIQDDEDASHGKRTDEQDSGLQMESAKVGSRLSFTRHNPISTSPRFKRNTGQITGLKLSKATKPSLIDFGLRPERTDTFSGYLRRRIHPNKSEILREFAEKANRHIYACQISSTIKRGSRTQLNISKLRESVSPRSRSISRHHTEEGFPKTVNKLTSLYRSDTMLMKKFPSYSFAIRTRNATTLSNIRANNEPLPEVTGYTLIPELGLD